MGTDLVEVIALIHKVKREQERGLERSKKTRFDNLYWGVRIGMMSELIELVKNLY
jgi:hypothetical protein